jgi:hypothetical protein
MVTQAIYNTGYTVARQGVNTVLLEELVINLLPKPTRAVSTVAMAKALATITGTISSVEGGAATMGTSGCQNQKSWVVVI